MLKDGLKLINDVDEIENKIKIEIDSLKLWKNVLFIYIYKGFSCNLDTIRICTAGYIILIFTNNFSVASYLLLDRK